MGKLDNNNLEKKKEKLTIVERTVQLFELMVHDLGYIKYDHLKQAWVKNAGKLCYSDLPPPGNIFQK